MGHLRHDDLVQFNLCACRAGTVSYDTPEAAEAAASVLDGFALGGKTLKVQVKKEAPKPY